MSINSLGIVIFNSSHFYYRRVMPYNYTIVSTKKYIQASITYRFCSLSLTINQSLQFYKFYKSSSLVWWPDGSMIAFFWLSKFRCIYVQSSTIAIRPRKQISKWQCRLWKFKSILQSSNENVGIWTTCLCIMVANV